jgi:hypothetical protein
MGAATAEPALPRSSGRAEEPAGDAASKRSDAARATISWAMGLCLWPIKSSAFEGRAVSRAQIHMQLPHCMPFKRAGCTQTHHKAPPVYVVDIPMLQEKCTESYLAYYTHRYCIY